jgi:hypothetical protein
LMVYENILLGGMFLIKRAEVGDREIHKTTSFTI